jgi:prepilin-type N-terminal cleavage/methylation domain-containing protein
MTAFRRRFTLVELLVVIAIIAILAGLLLPALVGAQQHAKRTRAQAEMKGLQTAIAMYESDYGLLPGCKPSMPNNTTDSEALTQAEYDGMIAALQGANARAKRYLDIIQGQPPLGGPGVMNDPWSSSVSSLARYRVALDLNYDGQINPKPPAADGPAVVVYGRVAVWSVGRDRTDDSGANGSDDVSSWKQ